jgi:tetratricopeptide (TPR) repeat protein
MTRPICFMIMPYGTKPAVKPAGAAGPDQIDFDRLWRAAFEPAIRQLGYDPVRADQDLGAAIIKEMIERLAISDLVIADVTTPNGNVYYEVGVRHAAKPTHCVLVAADWTRPLFDIDQMRQVRYPLPTSSVDDAIAGQIREIFIARVPELARGQSPVFEFLPGYPNTDPRRASAFRQTLEELSAFQAEVFAARSLPSPACTTKALELRDRFYGGGPVQTVVAVELLYLLRDCTTWDTTLQFIDSLPADLQRQSLVKEQRALAQSKSGDHHAAIGALRSLIDLDGDTSERRGLLGGRYKKLYSAEQDPDRKAGYLDQAIAEYEAGMQLDLNDYYPSSNLARLYLARNEDGDRDKARVSASVTAVACERARAKGGHDPWLKPTLLGAAFDAGDVGRAKALARDVRREGAAAWQLETTIADLRRAVTLHEGPTAAALQVILNDLEAMLTRR